MKKQKFIISILFLLLINSVNAQLNANVALGADTYKHIVYNFSVGYEVNRFAINAEMRPSATLSSKTNNYMGGKIGYNIFTQFNSYWTSWFIYPEIGYYFNEISSDKTILNKWIGAAGMRAYYAVKEESGLTGEVMYINKSAQLSFGIILKFE